MIPTQLGAFCIGAGLAAIGIYAIMGRDAWQQRVRRWLGRGDADGDAIIQWEDIRYRGPDHPDIGPKISTKLTRSTLGEHMERVLQEINAAELADLEAEFGRKFTAEEAREHWLRESMMQDVAEKIARRSGKMVN